MSLNSKRVFIALLAIATCLVVLWLAIGLPVRFLLEPFEPAVNPSDRLWALQSAFGDPKVCPYTWGGDGNTVMVHDCSANMAEAVRMSWYVHRIHTVIALAWLMGLAGLAGVAYGRLVKKEG